MRGINCYELLFEIFGRLLVQVKDVRSLNYDNGSKRWRDDSRFIFIQEVMLVEFGGGLDVEEEGKEGRIDIFFFIFSLSEWVEGSIIN